MNESDLNKMEAPPLRSSLKKEYTSTTTTVEHQLSEWVAGRSHHNVAREECCPDFSCCQPELLASAEVREAFRDGSEAMRMEMLGMFLGTAFESAGKSVHIAGGPYKEGA